MSIFNEITKEKAMKINRFSVEFDKIEVIFESCLTGVKKRLQFTKVLSLSYYADLWDDCHKNIVTDWEDDMDHMAYRTLIGFDFCQKGNTYEYCMKIDDYEIAIKSLECITLTNY